MKTVRDARNQAQEIVDNWVTATLLTGWIPGSALLSAGADQVMIRQVADCFGVGVFNMKAVTAHIGGVIGAGLGGGVAAEMLNLIPVVGWAAKSVTLAGKAMLIGDAVIVYFADQCALPN